MPDASAQLSFSCNVGSPILTPLQFWLLCLNWYSYRLLNHLKGKKRFPETLFGLWGICGLKHGLTRSDCICQSSRRTMTTVFAQPLISKWCSLKLSKSLLICQELHWNPMILKALQSVRLWLGQSFENKHLVAMRGIRFQSVVGFIIDIIDRHVLPIKKVRKTLSVCKSDQLVGALIP